MIKWTVLNRYWTEKVQRVSGFCEAFDASVWVNVPTLVQRRIVESASRRKMD